MRGVWLVIAIGLVGCTPTPKREMRQPITEELRSPPEGTYLTPPDVTRDEPALQPKQTGPGGGPGMGGMGAPGGPGAGPGMSPTTKR
jgi:hypothetical protein